MLEVNANQINKDEYDTMWAEIDGDLHEVFAPDEDFNEDAMTEEGYEPITLTLGDVSAKHRDTVYTTDRLFIKRY